VSAPSFDEVQASIQKLYQQGEYSAALDLATRQLNHFPDQAPLLNYWRICMAARLEDKDQSIHLLDEQTRTGFWYGEVLLRKSPSLQPMQGLPEFERLVGLNRQLQELDRVTNFPLITLRPEGECQGDSPPCPLLIGLHANGGTAQTSINFWRPAARLGFVVAVPQSTQAMWKDSYVWNDLEIAKEEVARDYARLIEKYSLDPQRVLLAGHSMGGEAAIWLALTGAIPARGFIAFGPGGPYMDNTTDWLPVIQERANLDLRGYIVVGERDDTIHQDGVRTLVEMLNREGIPCELEVIPRVGHDFVPEYEASLEHALEYVLQEE
jgi:pimeloyl-ACP methyl ester carboxylesterase